MPQAGSLKPCLRCGCPNFRSAKDLVNGTGHAKAQVRPSRKCLSCLVCKPAARPLTADRANSGTWVGAASGYHR